MRIGIFCPAPPRSRAGNRVTALRWASILRSLGHRVKIEHGDRPPAVDLLIVLHARRGAKTARQFKRDFPQRPLIVAMTGTDLYQDLARSTAARRTVALADRIVVLQSMGTAALPAALRPRARTIHQSVRPTPGKLQPSDRCFDLAVVGHLRSVKDPFRAALAARGLPEGSRIRILQAGSALAPGTAERALKEERENCRYHWLGDLPRFRARQLIARSRALVLSSRVEGGAHVLGEACVEGIPVLASRIPGSVGLLGGDYGGYFPVGNTRALRRLMLRLERDTAFRARLKAQVRTRRELFDPSEERRAWRALLSEVHASRAPSAAGRAPRR